MPRKPMAKGEGKFMLNKLTNIQQFDLMTWLSTQRDFHEKTGATTADILELAKKQFKFNLTANNVENAQVEDLGIKKKNKMAPKEEVENLKAAVDGYKIRVEQLEGHIAELRRHFGALAAEVTNKLTEQVAWLTTQVQSHQQQLRQIQKDYPPKVLSPKM